MAATRYSSSSDLRRQVGSPRSKGREHRDTQCRNVAIYGHCRYEDQGCAFNHDSSKNPSSHTEYGPKKVFNVESLVPFTPAAQQQQQATKKSTFSSQAANAAPFTPRGVSSTPAPQQNTKPISFNPGSAREFTPLNYDAGGTPSGNGVQDHGIYGDPFNVSNLDQHLPPAGQFNPYAADPTAISGSGTAFYPPGYQTGPVQPPLYHCYQPYDGYRQDLQPYQRATYDFFISKELREEMQKKMFATQQVMDSPLPQLERWHSLFPLDTSNRKNASSFDYPSWLYKARSMKNGRFYALRRLEGYRLTNETAIPNVTRDWKKIKNANIVTLHEIFTSRDFGDSSLIFAYDYHPMSKTLQEHHFPRDLGPRSRGAGGAGTIPEEVLWAYICQITNALKAIHTVGLAARCIEPSKIILSEKNRIRLAACAILDVVQYEMGVRPIKDLQQEDLVKFGKLMLSLATATPLGHLHIQTALDALAQKYSPSLGEAIKWLISTPSEDEPKTIENFIFGISSQMTGYFDLALQDGDQTKAVLAQELENGRIARIMMKMGMINERGDLGKVLNWSETGDKYQLKLFRDYVFHQVDADGKPVLSIGHILNCLNKLDAGVDEQIILTSADNETVFVPTYREIRGMLDRSFNELVKYKGNPAGAN